MVDWAFIACRLNSIWNRLVSRNNVIFSITGNTAALSSVTVGPFSALLKALVEDLPERRNRNNIAVAQKETAVLRGIQEETEGDESRLPPEAFTETPQWALEAEEKGILQGSTKKAYVLPGPVRTRF